MDYFICISISKSLVTFSYWQKGGGKPLTPFPWGEWPAPMSFYCSSSGIVIGEDAERAAANGRAGAFRDWFSLLSSGVTFDYMAKRYPINSLFLLAAEEQFRRFLREVLFDREGGLESVRGSLPLVLSFDNNVPEPYRLHVINLFKESGYGRVHDVFGNSYIASHYGRKFPDRTVLILDSDGTDLFMALYDPREGKVIDKKISEGYGSDPRVDQLSNILWNKTEAESAWLSKDKEYEKLRLEAIKILESDKSEISDTIEFSGGISLSYFITRVEVNNIHIPANKELSGVVRDFINRNHLDKEDDGVVLILRKYAATNKYFYRNLKNYFPQIVVDSDEERDDYGNLLVADVREWFKNFKADGNIEAKPIPTIEIVQKDIPEKEIVKPQASSEPIEKDNESNAPTSELPTSNRKWSREWRELRAEIKGKVGAGKTKDALASLSSFLMDCLSQQGPASIVGEVRDMIENLKKSSTPAVGPQKQPHKEGEIHPNGKWYWDSAAAGGKGDWRVIGGRNQQQKENRKDTEPEPKKPETEPKSMSDEGMELVKAGKLKEARDWYRANGDKGKADCITFIIRNEKSVDARKKSIDDYKKSRNVAQAKRIVEELREYIGKCEAVGLDVPEIKALMKEYQKIK